MLIKIPTNVERGTPTKNEDPELSLLVSKKVIEIHSCRLCLMGSL
jgi:hypothetical protein